MFWQCLNAGMKTTHFKNLSSFLKAMKIKVLLIKGFRCRFVYLNLYFSVFSTVTRVVRVISQLRGNMLLVGVGGSGRQSLAKMAAFICEFQVFQVEVTKQYRKQEFREGEMKCITNPFTDVWERHQGLIFFIFTCARFYLNLIYNESPPLHPLLTQLLFSMCVFFSLLSDIKKLYRLTGVDNKPTVFLFNDTQIVDESFLEDINNILSSGEVPNLYKQDEFVEVCIYIFVFVSCLFAYCLFYMSLINQGTYLWFALVYPKGTEERKLGWGFTQYLCKVVPSKHQKAVGVILAVISWTFAGRRVCCVLWSKHYSFQMHGFLHVSSLTVNMKHV